LGGEREIVFVLFGIFQWKKWKGTQEKGPVKDGTGGPRECKAKKKNFWELLVGPGQGKRGQEPAKT